LTNTHVAKIIRQRQNPFAAGSVEAKASQQQLLNQMYGAQS